MAPLVEGEGVGVTYPPGEPEALGLALAALARDPAQLSEIRRKAREVALGRYNAEAQRDVLAEVWAVS
jgi:glycosyltransferase involved in cell wall biosynthesis